MRKTVLDFLTITRIHDKQTDKLMHMYLKRNNKCVVLFTAGKRFNTGMFHAR